MGNMSMIIFLFKNIRFLCGVCDRVFGGRIIGILMFKKIRFYCGVCGRGFGYERLFDM